MSISPNSLKTFQIIILLLFNLTIANQSFSDTPEDKVTKISKKLMCPVCQGQSVADSNSDLANDMRSIIKKRVAKGENEEEILQYFVNRYGESILSSPPAKGFNIIIWILPLLTLIFGLIFLVYFFTLKNRQIRKLKDPMLSESQKKQSKYIEMVDSELENFNENV